MKDSFVFYKDWYDSLQELNDEEKFACYDAIFKYAFEGIEPNDKFIRMCIKLIMSFIDNNEEKYARIIERRKEAGRKGGLKRIANIQANQANQANASFVKQIKQSQANQANQADNVNDNDNVIIDTPVSNDTSVSNDNNLFIDLDKPKSTSFENDAEAKIQKEIIQFFNSEIKKANSQIPPVKKIVGQRKGFLNGRLREYGKDAVLTVIKKAAESDFLNGCGNKAFVASFDWIFRPTNFPKILEGNYDNKIRKPDMNVGVVWHQKGEDYYKETKENLW